MIIERMSIGNWGNIKAFFDLRTTDGFLIKGMKLVKGIHGMFAAPPSKADKDGKYNDIVQTPRELGDEITKMAIEKYDSENKHEFEDIPGVFDESSETEDIF